MFHHLSVLCLVFRNIEEAATQLHLQSDSAVRNEQILNILDRENFSQKTWTQIYPKSQTKRKHYQ